MPKSSMCHSGLWNATAAADNDLFLEHFSVNALLRTCATQKCFVQKYAARLKVCSRMLCDRCENATCLWPALKGEAALN